MGLPEKRNASYKNSEEAAELERKFGGKSLFHRLKYTEPWKMRLESLIESNISATTADKDMSENMLIYLCATPP